jgi:GNAT superfamily N-acetyltransferase
MRVDKPCQAGTVTALNKGQDLPLGANKLKRWEREVRLRDGTPARLRPIRPSDEPLLKELLESCSEETIYKRFFLHMKFMSHATLHKLVRLDFAREAAVLAVVEWEGRERAVAVGRYVRERVRNFAEVAFLVQDDFQGRGVGTLLFENLMSIAREQGIEGFTADVLADNLPMLCIFHRGDCEAQQTLAANVYHLELRFKRDCAEAVKLT